MKNKIIKTAVLSCMGAVLALSSCDEFLDRPTEDSPVCSDFYSNEAELQQAANILYGSPWFDFQRGCYQVLEGIAGNSVGLDADIYRKMMLASASTDANLTGMSNSLWAVIAQSNVQLKNINDYSTCSTELINKYKGEIMVMKSAAYFFLVRIWGDVPLIHNTSDVVASGSSFTIGRTKKADIYKYIISTLQQAAEYLPETNGEGRVDKYSAYGLLAKVYLTAAGVSGSLDKAYLEKAKEYAAKVYANKKHSLEETYENLWRISTGDNNPEGLITLHWNSTYSPYTSINMLHCDINLGSSFSGTAGWGSSTGPSVDLIENVFGQNPFEKVDYTAGEDRHQKLGETDKDIRRKGNILMEGDYVDFWYRDSTRSYQTQNCFYATWQYEHEGETDANKEYRMMGEAQTTCMSGGQHIKYIYGNVNDHVAECGATPNQQASCVPIHILRVADVYLCYAEADFLLNGNVSGEPLEALNAVRKRAGLADASSSDYSTIDAFILERRKELCFEFDNWFDIVRLSYYDANKAKELMNARERGIYNFQFCDYYNGTMTVFAGMTAAQAHTYARQSLWTEVSGSTYPTNQAGEEFAIPYSQNDYTVNPKLSQPAEDYDFSQVEYYDESTI
jgi:hypothetical protein